MQREVRTSEGEVEGLQHLILHLEMCEISVAQQQLLLEFICGGTRLDVPHSALVTLETEVHVLRIAACSIRYCISMPVW